MKNKLFSIFTALAMVLGILVAPFTSAKAAGTDEITKSVTVHKLLAKEGKTLEDIQNALKDKYVGSDKYIDGDQEKDIKGLYTDEATEIGGVFFALQKQVDGQWKYVAKDGTSVAGIQDPTTKGFADQVLGGETTAADGYKFDTSKLDQSKPTTYKIVEIHSLSSYKSADGKVLTDKLAVPVEITLPLVNAKGVVTAAHVYPKNTEDKPKIDKNFDTAKNGDVNGITKDDLTTDTKDKSLEINLENEKSEKPTAVKSVGQSVPYKVVTEIPAQTKWATAKWDDKMTEGLTYNKDLTIELKKGTDTVALTENTDYTLTQTDDGFVLNFEKAGLEKLNNKAQKQTLTLKYTAKVNDKSVVKVPESNDITFHYGNNPGHGNTPKPNKPDDNGNLKVTKTWADGKWAKNEKAKFKLVDAQTGKDVEAKDLVGAPKDYTFVNEQEIGYTEGETKGEATWKYLDKNREYKVVETSVTYTDEKGKEQTLTGWEAEYAVNGKGTTKITNYLTNNPKPLNPSEPKVVTYGAKFVKTNVEGERLPGAEFVVKNEDGNFLVEGTKATRTEYEKAQEAFVDAVKAYNAKVKKGETPTPEEKANVEKLEKARDAAWNATLQNMDGFTAKKKNDAGVLKLTSNELGQFEIAGLKPGKYTLVEVKAPKDYVDADKATLEFGFTIGKNGEQDLKDIDFGIDDDNQADNAQKIVNKKVSIPQTGGIGSLIFIVAGVAIMAFAFVAYKRSEAREA
ncbi:isopeptide-forming domain-containing fimbrial protein [Anaerococcus tetradius]|uniref:isopeptide-forming domain-containing fimbrial protein n=1 Tax=Anaerococcus tetradius TaxID=33036 RepID=UPI0023F1AC90|nr:isopeptide-forming domain-containing fimbrial protein [Anaerococcus tetradius]